MCSTHYTRWAKHGDPLVVLKTGRKPGYGASEHGMYRGDKVGYHGAHKRIYRLRGPASSRPCADCGKQAQQWSYDGADPDERIDLGRGAFSLDPERYQPRCIRCHKTHDVAALKSQGWTVWNKGPEVCSESGCDRKAHARELCSTHYGRWWRAGRVDAS